MNRLLIIAEAEQILRDAAEAEHGAMLDVLEQRLQGSERELMRAAEAAQDALSALHRAAVAHQAVQDNVAAALAGLGLGPSPAAVADGAQIELRGIRRHRLEAADILARTVAHVLREIQP